MREEGLNVIESDKTGELFNKSIVQDLIGEDKMREATFKVAGFYPKRLMINFDFNFNTTIYRGLKMKSMQSIKYLLDFMFKEVNSSEYYKLIMMDMHELMSSNFNSSFM